MSASTRIHQDLTSNTLATTKLILNSNFIHQNKDILSQANRRGLTLLQIAARDNLIDVAIMLLYAGAQVDQTSDLNSSNAYLTQQAKASPLFLAMERGHIQLAEILFVFHANKKKALALASKNQELFNAISDLTLSKTTINELLYWGTKRYNPSFKNRLFDHLTPFIKTKSFSTGCDNKDVKETKKAEEHYLQDEISSLIELAAYENKQETVEALLKLGNHRDSSRYLTAAYWACYHKNESLFEILAINNPEAAATGILQLLAYAPQHFFEARQTLKNKSNTLVWAKKVSEHLQSLLMHSNGTLPSESLSSENAIINYRLLSRNAFEIKDMTVETAYEIADYAARKKQFIVLSNLLNMKELIYPLFLNALKKEDRQLASFILIYSNQERYDFMLECFKNNLLHSWFQFFHQTHHGVADDIIRRGLRLNNAISTEEIKALSALDDKNRNITSLILRRMGDYYDDGGFIQLLLQHHTPLAQRIESVLSSSIGRSCFKPSMIPFINSHFKKMKIDIDLNSFLKNDLLPAALWNKIGSFLKPDERLKMQCISRQLNTALKQSFEEGNKEFLQACMGFIDAVEKNKIPFYRHRRRGDKLSVLFHSANLTIGGFAIYEIIQCFQRADFSFINENCKGISEQIDNSLRCRNLNTTNPDALLVTLCRQNCDQLDANSYRFLSIFGLLFLLIPLYSLLMNVLYRNQDKNPRIQKCFDEKHPDYCGFTLFRNRTKELLDLPVLKHPDAVKLAASYLFSLSKQHINSDPFENCTLQSPVKQVLELAKQSLTVKHFPIQQSISEHGLFKEMKEIKEFKDVKDIKETKRDTKMIQQDDACLDYSINIG